MMRYFIENRFWRLYGRVCESQLRVFIDIGGRQSVCWVVLGLLRVGIVIFGQGLFFFQFRFRGRVGFYVEELGCKGRQRFVYFSRLVGIGYLLKGRGLFRRLEITVVRCWDVRRYTLCCVVCRIYFFRVFWSLERSIFTISGICRQMVTAVRLDIFLRQELFRCGQSIVISRVFIRQVRGVGSFVRFRVFCCWF